MISFYIKNHKKGKGWFWRNLGSLFWRL